MKIVMLQPLIPHYRTEFFQKLKERCQICDIFLYEDAKKTKSEGFKISDLAAKHVRNFTVKGVLFYNPFPFLKTDYETIVLMFQFFHVTTWILLLTKFIHRKKIVLWGPGISVKRYLKEEKKPDWRLKWQLALADGIWTYMEKEAEQWRKIFPNKPIIALNNTISGIDKIVENHNQMDKTLLKSKYNIPEEIILMFCARFQSNNRRTDLLVETMQRLDSQKYGFIIIGDGDDKPDFSSFKNVHDFGAVYDDSKKSELFKIADLYYQPGWVGLSIVEAMAYGKPICTFKRTDETKQCVEYSYIHPNSLETDTWNGMIFHSIEDALSKITSLSHEEIETMSNNSYKFAKEHLSVSNMVNRAISIIKQV